MKKMLIMLFCFFVVLSVTVSADDGMQNLTDKLNAIWLSPTEEPSVLETIKTEMAAICERDIEQYLKAPGWARIKIGLSDKDDVLREQVKDYTKVLDDEILKQYQVKYAGVYAKQYADNGMFGYLIPNDYILVMKERRFASDGHYLSGGFWAGDEVLLKLKDIEFMNTALDSLDSTQIYEIKQVVIFGNPSIYCLYIDCLDKEYLFYLRRDSYLESKDGHNTYRSWAEELEGYKLYEAKEFFNIISESENMMNQEKPTFDAEAQSLQAEGLLYGNEKGLDLLKPMTRMEAAAMLMRAIGRDEDASQNAKQTFSDVPSTHWGYAAAEKAYELGIVAGVGDGKFAPEKQVTAEQFATMTLNAAGRTEFDWQNAVSILIENGIITQEDASTMDLFTRGDMAKIIYEARAKGLFPGNDL